MNFLRSTDRTFRRGRLGLAGWLPSAVLPCLLLVVRPAPGQEVSNREFYAFEGSVVAEMQVRGLLANETSGDVPLQIGPLAVTTLQKIEAQKVIDKAWQLKNAVHYPGTNPSKEIAEKRWQDENQGLTLARCGADPALCAHVLAPLAKTYLSADPSGVFCWDGSILVKNGGRGVAFLTSNPAEGVGLVFSLLPAGRGGPTRDGTLLAAEALAVLANPLHPLHSVTTSSNFLDPLGKETLRAAIAGTRRWPGGAVVQVWAAAPEVNSCLIQHGWTTRTLPSSPHGDAPQDVFMEPRALAVVPWNEAMDSDDQVLKLTNDRGHECWPTPLTVASGDYPLRMELWCRVLPSANAAEKEFAAYLASRRSQEAWLRAGFIRKDLP